MKKSIVFVTAISLALGLTGCATVEDTATHDCIDVIVDYASLKPGTYIEKCIVEPGETAALDVLYDAGVVTEGSEKYGDAVVCRVDGLPSATEPIGLPDNEDYIETCKDMAPEFAYWAVLVKKHHGKFEWAQTGISEVKLNPGEAIALVFSENGTTNFPK